MRIFCGDGEQHRYNIIYYSRSISVAWAGDITVCSSLLVSCSGHGLSGMALFFWLSIVAVPAMFAGGIGTAFAMDATGALTSFVCHEGTAC